MKLDLGSLIIHISNNIRLVLDILDYYSLISDDCFLLFLDFYKAFDTLELIFKCLERFVFGDFFCSAIKTLYTNGSSSVILKHGATHHFVPDHLLKWSE